MKVLITGVAGFIGSHLADHYLAQGVQVAGIDNFSTGQSEFLVGANKNPGFKLFQSDLFNYTNTEKILKEFKPDAVVHLAANADVRFGLNHPRKDLEQGTICTFNILEASRQAGVKQFAYSSTGSVYGEPTVFPTPESCSFPIQTSLYAASKLAGEALIQSYAEGYGIKGYIFRFVSILGERYTHGHIFDFAKKIKANSKSIEVLGDGNQQKAYLYVGDCIRAIDHIMKTQNEKINIFNLGPDEYLTVNQSLDVICKTMNVQPTRDYTGGKRGWIGDSPFIFLDCTKLKKTGWKATRTIRESVEITLKYLLENSWLLERRS
ncbi:MAG: NAD-dependent epimerase/dehydratase family protein [Oligoflexia bacterium]|nr:NAD-dependent epimerase/dehydratase family protein [Oligoflexia bacterium]